MCGITGFTHKNSVPDPNRIREATNSIIHRGPDQQGVHESKTISLGATRLKIIDLTAGAQPMFSDDGDLVIAFNGEIYNFRELRVELEQRGHRFKTHTDTEVVLRGFLEWDVDCFSRLRGMFAIALWTESARRLVLCRDRLGIKPLYIARQGEDLLFGSELKTILVHSEFQRRLSLNGLDCYLSLNYVLSPWTLIEGIEKLPPGHWLEWRDGKVRTESYWKLPFVPPQARTLESAKEELDSLLRDAVREHLVSDVPLGVWLSGGMDSSTILHYAAQASPSRLKTFSISFRGRTFDESIYIDQVARQYGTEHEQFDLNPDVDLESAIREFAYYSDEPTADAGALPIWFLSKMMKKSATVSLSGEGGDELFGGYITHRANRFAKFLRRFPNIGIRLGLTALRAWPVSDEKISLEYKMKRFLDGCLMSPERAHVYWNGTFSDDQKRRMSGSQLPEALESVLAPLRGLSSEGGDLRRFMWFDQRYFLPDDILNKVDRMSMAHAVEVRPPLLDHRLVEFTNSLPASFMISGSRQKFILKRLMEGKLPAPVLSRKKMGLDIPAHEWLRGPLRPILLETLRTGVARYPGFFRSEQIEALLRRHLERRENLGYQLWGLMILFLWMEQWQVQPA